MIFPVKDGDVAFLLAGGAVGAASMRAFVAWMDEEGEGPPGFGEKAWETWDYAGLRTLGAEAMQAEFDAVEAVFAAFPARRTRACLYEEALRRRIMLAPVSEPRHLLEGHALRLLACPPAWRSAPVWGGHTERVFGDILGLAGPEIDRLRAAEVIW